MRSPSAHRWLAILLLLLATQWACQLASAHEGEAHGAAAPAPAVTGEAHPTHTATTPDLEVVVRHEPLEPGKSEVLRIYLSDFASNAPIGRARVDLVLRSTQGIAWQGRATPTRIEGIYEAPAVVRRTGTYNLIMTVGGPRQATLAMPGIEVAKQATSEEGGGWLLPTILALLLGIGVGVLVSRRHALLRLVRRPRPAPEPTVTPTSRSGSVRLILVVVLLLTPLADVPFVRGHEGHEAAPATAGVVLQAGGTVWLTKESQFAARVRTIITKEEWAPQQIMILGRVAPSPTGKVEITAPQAGRLDPARGGRLPLLGETVRRGQPLARLLVIDALTLRSPISGVVTEVEAVPGQMVQAGQKLFEIVDPTNVWVHADVFPSDLEIVGRATHAAITVPGLTTSPLLAGRRVATGSTAGETPGTTEVWFAVWTRTGLLKPGAIVNVAVDSPVIQKGVRVPRNALIERSGQQVAFVHTAPERFEMRAVTVQPGTGETVFVTDGLRAGERVVVIGGYQVLTGGVPLATP